MQNLGPYQIEKLLGRGGMGSVYLATHRETGEQAAVKTLSQGVASDPGFRDRFVGEIESLKKLRHPNIVQLFGWGEEDGQLFYVMEYIEGENLQTQISNGREFSWRRVMQIAIDICRGLKHAHDSGVIHRDLKPANLVVTQNGTVKLLDFGIAKLFGYTQLTVEGGVMGTADFMAPEQAHGNPVTPRCDLYSLGTVLYNLVAGRPPFAAKTLPEVLHKLCYEEPQPLKRFAPDTPQALVELIHDLLEKQPEKRVPTAVALLKRLEAVQHGLHKQETRMMTPPVDDEAEFELAEPGEPVLDPSVHSAATRFAPKDDSKRLTKLADKESVQGQETGNLDTVIHTKPSGSDATPTETPEESQTVAKTHFTTIDEASADTSPWSSGQTQSIWVIGGLVAALVFFLGLVGFLATRSPTADELYQRITAAAEADDAESLSSVADEIEQFAQLYPDDNRVSEVASLGEEIELSRLARKYERAARRPGTAARLSPVERAYLAAIDVGRRQPEDAIERLQIIVDTYGVQDEPSESTSQVITLAQRQIERLQAAVDESGEAHLDELNATLDAADDLAATDWDSAERVYRGTIQLYDGQPWAKAAVTRARRSLANAQIASP